MVKVFLVEDEMIVRESIKNNMKWAENGFDFCGEASDGELALPKIQNLKPDIVITDIKMPFMDGLELSRLVKKEFEFVKIVVLSGYDAFEYAKEAIDIGVTKYLIKPITSNELMKALNSIREIIIKEKMERENIELFRRENIENDIIRKRSLMNESTTVTGNVSKLLEEILSRNDNKEYKLAQKEDLNLKNIDVAKIDKKAIDLFLRNGSQTGVPHFIEEYFESMGEASIKSLIFRQYVAIDMYLTAVVFVEQLGYNSDKVNREFSDISGINAIASDIESTKVYLEKVFTKAISLRDLVSLKRYNTLIIKAKEYIECHYFNEEISLNSTAAKVNMSPSHFSMIFSQETGETFIGYLTEVRMNKAKELLRCTDMKSSEIAYAVGYKDPHYFSSLFKKTQEVTPKEFRSKGGRTNEDA